MLVWTKTEANRVPSLNELGALHTAAAYLDLAALDRLCGKRAGFVKTRGPKPFVESNFGPFVAHPLKMPPGEGSRKASDAESA